jgi:hypothetical protein
MPELHIQALQGLSAADGQTASKCAQQLQVASEQWAATFRLRAAALLAATKQAWKAALPQQQQQQQQQGAGSPEVPPSVWGVWARLGNACGLLACAATDWCDAAAVQQLMQDWVVACCSSDIGSPQDSSGSSGSSDDSGSSGSSRLAASGLETGASSAAAGTGTSCLGWTLQPGWFQYFWALLKLWLPSHLEFLW